MRIDAILGDKREFGYQEERVFRDNGTDHEVYLE